MIPIGILNPNERSTQDLNTEQAGFLWFQLLIEVLVRLPKTLSSKKEMIQECRVSYQENEVQLKKIAVFEATYDEKSAITWYTEYTFIYRLFNMAFRTQNIDIIFKYRYFFIDFFEITH
ncbi:unnamed protein product [Rotaria magnacalcarata]|uniref:Uncharacterized protein n=1 Tax=Rotaria magnacalcarata TaxID=392030 RepID=A0A819F8H6_9BILA|nr:unnamed protein product [Rotaria magnacalcarata]CAF3864374.1 unnamed protein product [Rotaria magnacalcarata]